MEEGCICIPDQSHHRVLSQDLMLVLNDADNVLIVSTLIWVVLDVEMLLVLIVIIRALFLQL